MQNGTLALAVSSKLPKQHRRVTIDGMEYVSVEEAAEITGYSEQYIRRLLRQGKVEATKKGYMWWVSLASLKEYKRQMDILGRDKFNPHKED